MSQLVHADWRSSPAHLFLAGNFLGPRTAAEVTTLLNWQLALDEDPEQVLGQFLAMGVLKYTDQGQTLAERLAKFKVQDLRELARARDLPVSGRKEDLISRLVSADPEGLEEVDRALRALHCTAQGRQAIKEYLVSARATSANAVSESPGGIHNIIGEPLKHLAERIIGDEPPAEALHADSAPGPDDVHLPEAREHVDRGCTYGNNGQYEQAVNEFERAIELNPSAPLPYFWRGLAYERLGDHLGALVEYRRAVSLDPQRAEFYAGRGDAYRRLGELQVAIQEYEKAIERDPNLVLAYHNRGITFEASGDYRQALADYDKAIELQPDKAQPHFGRGAVYERVGEYDAAADEYELVLTLTDDEEILRSARQRLQEVLLYL